MESVLDLPLELLICILATAATSAHRPGSGRDCWDLVTARRLQGVCKRFERAITSAEFWGRKEKVCLYRAGHPSDVSWQIWPHWLTVDKPVFDRPVLDFGRLRHLEVSRVSVT